MFSQSRRRPQLGPSPVLTSSISYLWKASARRLSCSVKSKIVKCVSLYNYLTIFIIALLVCLVCNVLSSALLLSCLREVHWTHSSHGTFCRVMTSCARLFIITFTNYLLLHNTTIRSNNGVFYNEIMSSAIDCDVRRSFNVTSTDPLYRLISKTSNYLNNKIPAITSYFTTLFWY